MKLITGRGVEVAKRRLKKERETRGVYVIARLTEGFSLRGGKEEGTEGACGLLPPLYKTKGVAKTTAGNDGIGRE